MSHTNKNWIIGILFITTIMFGIMALAWYHELDDLKTEYRYLLENGKEFKTIGG